MKSLLDPPVRDEVLGRLRRVGPDTPRLWGRMSSHQMICHLSDSFRVASGERQAGSAGTWVHRTVFKWIALHVPAHWPREYRTMPEVDQEIGGTAPVAFALDRDELERIVGRFSGDPQAVDGRPHPIFGAMTSREWMRWGYLHMDHHLRQFGV